MQIKYKKWGLEHEDKYKTCSLNIFIDSCLENKYFEDTVRKITNIVSYLLEDYLIKNPNKLDEIIDILEVEGYDFKVVEPILEGK